MYAAKAVSGHAAVPIPDSEFAAVPVPATGYAAAPVPAPGFAAAPVLDPGFTAVPVPAPGFAPVQVPGPGMLSTPTIVTAPPMTINNMVYLNYDEWRVGLCDCMEDDAGLCCLTFWCTCITFGRLVEIVDRGATPCATAGSIYILLVWFTGCQWIYGWINRTKLRAQHNLPEDPCCDICVHFWCHLCAICQEYKELERRGYNMEIGWRLNVLRQNAARQLQMQPPMVQVMARPY